MSRSLNHTLCQVLAVFVSLYTVVSQAACTSRFKVDDFSDLEQWRLSANVTRLNEDRRNRIVLRSGAPFGSGISRDISLETNAGRYMVVRSRIKGENLRTGKPSYRQAKTMLTYYPKDGQKRRFAENYSGTFGWRDAALVAEIPPGIDKVELHLRNEAADGNLYIDRVEVLVCDSSDLASLDYPNSWHALVQSASAVDATLALDTTGWKALNKQKYGFNPSFFYSQARPGKLLELPEVTALNMKLIRFPGGIESNLYRWEDDGYRASDLDSFPALNTAGRRKLYSKFSPGINTTGFLDVARWANQHRVRMTLVLNVTRPDTLTQSIAFLKFASKNGIEVPYIELGNELYFRDQGGIRIKDASQYINVVRPLIRQLRQQVPATKIGIPMSHDDWEWNDQIRSANLDFDACVVHPYASTSSIATVGGDQALFEYAAHGIAQIFDRFQTTFPSKTIWVTEWGFEDRPFFRRSNSLAGILFAASTFVTLLREPAVEIAAYHTLLGGSMGLFDIPDAPAPAIRPARKYPYFFWSMIGGMVDDVDTTQAVTVRGNDASATAYVGEHLRLQAFKGGQRTYLLAVNDGASPVRLTLSGISGISTHGHWRAIRAGSQVGPITVERGERDPIDAGNYSNDMAIAPLSVVLIEPRTGN